MVSPFSGFNFLCPIMVRKFLLNNSSAKFLISNDLSLPPQYSLFKYVIDRGIFFFVCDNIFCFV